MAFAAPPTPRHKVTPPRREGWSGREWRSVGVGSGIEKSLIAKLKLIYMLCV